MQRLEGQVLRGTVNVLKFDEHGRIVDIREVRNMIVNVGKTGCAHRISDPATGLVAANWIALGTGTTAPAAGDTTLAAEISRKSAAFSELGVGSWKIVQQWGAGEAVAGITESGVFFGTYNSMLCRTTFAVINKASGDTLEITWGFTIS